MAEEANVSSSSSSQVIEKKKKKNPLSLFYKDARLVFKKDEIGIEIMRIAFPAALALAADPIASLIDTAFIGRIGSVELAAVGVSIAVFNQVSKVAIFPLVSVTTSFVAEEEAASRLNSEEQEQETDNLEKGFPINNCNEMKELMSSSSSSDIDAINNKSTTSEQKISSAASIGVKKASELKKKKKKHVRKHIPSATSALIIGGVLGLLQAVLLIFGAKPILNFMGVKSDSPMLNPARQYLTLRSLGAPAILLSLAMQGIFRGFKDTKTPLYATVAGDVANIILDPILMFVFHLGVSGAAIAHIMSQYLISILLLWRLMKKVDLLPPSLKELPFRRFFTSGFLLLGRVIAVTFCVTLAASLAARHGSISMAAFQICLQIWMTTSLLADGLAIAAQAILATAFAENDLDKATATTSRVLQMGMVLGLALSIIIGVGLQFGSSLFTKDINVIHLISIGVPFVAATQPINSLAFVFDGVNFGASDFAYTAYSMASS
ncbi:Multi antimicrobial extrusion protein [Macleaya cordata]|uniref:Protein DETOXIFICATION n=1 Tax=Macleaya cordata TaxID=56857 RepID=A0A200R3D9_MACCD|nr:Multi antimicrobial extrusion protein [Macleaya cordata]